MRKSLRTFLSLFISAFFLSAMGRAMQVQNGCTNGIGVSEQSDANTALRQLVTNSTIPSAADLSFRLPAIAGLLDVDWGAGAGRPSPATPGSSAISRLSLRLYGGFSYLAAGDVNSGASHYFDVMNIYSAMGNGTVSGRYHPLHAGFDFGGDLIYQITSKIGVGLGVGYLRSSNDSGIAIVGYYNYTVTAGTALSAVPIRLFASFGLPLLEKLDLIVDGGAAYYALLKFDHWDRVVWPMGGGTNESVSATRSNPSGNLGFQGSLGLEYRLSSRWGFFIKAAGRYARFKTFEKATEKKNMGIWEGKLYLRTAIIPQYGSFNKFDVLPVQPVDGPSDTFREPKIDMSGFSLQTGIRLRF